MKSIYRATERDEKEYVGIGSRKVVMVAVRSVRGRKTEGQLNGLDALIVDTWVIIRLTALTTARQMSEEVVDRRALHTRKQRQATVCLLNKTKSHSNDEYLKQRNN